MITALLTAVVFWCVFYGRIPSAVLAVLCATLAVTILIAGRHEHSQPFEIDMLAQASRLNKVNPALKFGVVLLLMVLCVASPGPASGVFLTILVPVLLVFAGGLKFHDYIQLLALPVSFLMLSGLALLFQIGSVQTGAFSIRAFGLWFCVSTESQIQTSLVISRAIGAVSCLYLLSLTTPMSSIIGVLRRAHCPGVIIELMYLMYRYIFILISGYHTMHNAAKSRLGFSDYRKSLRTTGMLYSNLLIRSYSHARQSFDAMESRCYDTEIRFLENNTGITGIHIFISACITIITLCLSLLFPLR